MGWIGFSCKPDPSKFEQDLRQSCKDNPNSPLALAMAAVEPHARAAGVLADPQAGMGWVCAFGKFADEGWSCHAIGDIWFPDDENIYIPRGQSVSYHFRCLEKLDKGMIAAVRWLSIPEIDGHLINGSPGEPWNYWVNLDSPAKISIQEKKEAR